MLNAKMMLNGNVLIFCKDEAQRERAMKVRHLLNRPVECFMFESSMQNVKGVIYVGPEITESAIVSNLQGAEVEAARRFREEGTAVLLTFKQEVKEIPERVYLGFMSFQVREYKRPPLRCYKCQRFGHTAAACRGVRRCGKCGGNHEFAQCQAREAKCCNCGGNHVTSFRGCEHHVMAVEIERVRAGGEMSYAEAVRKVRGTEERATAGGSRVHAKPGVEEVAVQVMTKQSFLAFMADVLWAAKNQTRRSDVIKVVIDAAERFLEEVQVGPEQLHTFMRQKVEMQERARVAERERKSTDRSEKYEEGSMDVHEDGDDDD